MKKFLLFTLSFIFSFTLITAQVVILDFETTETSTTFQYFGSDLEFEDPNHTLIIENPDQSGINTSAMVGQFNTLAAGQVWQGAFSEPNPSTPINLVSATEVCLDVWVPQTTLLALKLEQGSLDNWVTTQEITETSTWTEVCFDITANSIEAPELPAAGGVYARAVLFFDFNLAHIDGTYYFDNLEVVGGSTDPVDITFNVDMSDYDGTVGQMYLSGSFNEWSGDGNPMTDNGDGTWTTTLNLAPGTYEYKFTMDNWAVQEEFNGFETCTSPPTAEFKNRIVVVALEETLPTVCWNSCYACGEGVMVTIELGQGAVVPSADGFFIAGGGNFGGPGDFPLTAQGDGTHTLTIERPVGFSSFYTFTNGACPDFSCKENIAGQDCANQDNFNDRFMGPITQDTIIATCFGLCTPNSDCADPNAGDITLEVDMNGYAEAFTQVYLSGSFNAWSGDANPMADDDGDGIWSITLPLNGGSYAYKFTHDNWTGQEFWDTVEGDCLFQDGDFVNRQLEVMGDASACFVWGTCTGCTVDVNDLDYAGNIFEVRPTIARHETQMIFGTKFNGDKTVHVFNAIGQMVEAIEIPAGTVNHTLDVADLEDGLYFINVATEGKQQTQRIIVNRK
jgi:hypothetical protein